VYCLNVPFLRTVKHNNFVPYDLSLYNCGHEKSHCYPEKENICPENEECGLKRACCGEEEEEYCYCCFCRGAQNISVTKKSEEVCVKIRIQI